MFSYVLCGIVAGYFKLGFSRNISVAEYTNFSNPMKDWNSPRKWVSPSYGSQSASAARTAHKKTSLIKPKAAIIGRDCVRVAISSIILTKYQWCVGVGIFTTELQSNQLHWKLRVAYSCVAYREMAARAHAAFLRGHSAAFTCHTQMDVIPTQLQTLWTLFRELRQEEPSATSPACACSSEQNSSPEVSQIFGMPVPSAVLN